MAHRLPNDLIAIGAIKALKLRGYKIPDDIAIIGFDNISEGRILDPSLTTIDIPRRFMGQTAVDQLIRQMEETVVMRDNNDAFALLFEFRKKDRVKILPEFRILLCGPFVKQHKRLFGVGRYRFCFFLSI